MVIIMRHAPHPNVIRYISQPRRVGTTFRQYFEFCSADGIKMVEGLASASSVTPRRLTDAEAKEIMRSIAGALRHCHGLGIFHLDIKPENILVDERGVYKIADFGSSSIEVHVGKDCDCEAPSSPVSPTGVVEVPPLPLPSASASASASQTESKLAAAPALPPLPTLKVRQDRGSYGMRAGTVMYAAPEAFYYYDHDFADLGAKLHRLGCLDVWSLAMTILVMRCGFMPWDVSRVEKDMNFYNWAVAYEKYEKYDRRSEHRSVLQAMLADAVSDAQLQCRDVHLSAICPEFMELLIGMLNPNPAHRLTMAEVCEDPWLK